MSDKHQYLGDRPETRTPEQIAIDKLKEQIQAADAKDGYVRYMTLPDDADLLKYLLEQAQNRKRGVSASLPFIRVQNPNSGKQHQTEQTYKFLVRRPDYEPLQGYFTEDDDDDERD